MSVRQYTGHALTPIKVLLITGDGQAASPLIGSFERSGISTRWAKTAVEAMGVCQSERFDVAVLSLSLQDALSLDVIAWFDRTNTGVLALSSTEGEGERILALEIGADDVTAASTTPRELVARIRAIHRRASDKAPKTKAHFGDLCVDFNRSLATVSGERLRLTAAEFSVLELLASQAGKVVSRDALSLTALRRPWRAEDRSIDQLVFALRQRLPVDDDGGALIQTVRGGGYKVRLPDPAPTIRQPADTADTLAAGADAWTHARRHGQGAMAEAACP